MLRGKDPYPEKKCDGTRSTACTDCSTIKICISSDESKDADNPQQACPASAPHCAMSQTGAVCQKTPDSSVEDCSAASSDFTCTGPGFYPDTSSCQQYHDCSDASAEPVTYYCPDGTRFSSKFIACEQYTGSCPKVCNQTDSETIFSAFPGDSQYYTYCKFDTTQTPPKLEKAYVFACGEEATFDAKLGKCVFKCPKVGLFANTANPKRYFSCISLSGKLTYLEMACGAKMTFDSKAKRCVAIIPPKEGNDE